MVLLKGQKFLPGDLNPNQVIKIQKAEKDGTLASNFQFSSLAKQSLNVLLKVRTQKEEMWETWKVEREDNPLLPRPEEERDADEGRGPEGDR